MQSYDNISRKLHWLIGFIIIALIIVGFIMESMAKSPTRGIIYNLHKSFGVTILCLMIFRIIWKLNHTHPKLPNTIPRWQQIAAHITHGFLYLIGILMPLSGLLMSVSHGHPPNIFGLFILNFPNHWIKPYANFFSSSHSFLAWLFSLLIIMHIGAAFSHGINKNGIIWRMWKK